MFNFKKHKTKDLRANAFFSGTQNAAQADALKEIAAEFAHKGEAVKLRAIDGIRTLEAEMSIAAQRKGEAEAHWRRMENLADGRTPEFGKPLLATLTAALLIPAEGALLAPTMDGLNIPQPLVQWLVATVMVVALSGLLKWAVHSFRQTPRKMWQVIAPAAFSLTTLAIFGWWRGEEVVFAGVQSAENGNTFAAENAFLTKLLLTLVTIALPTLAAIALEFGMEQLRLWREHRRARREWLRLSAALETKEKKLAAAIEKRDGELERTAQERETWLAAARDAFTEGQVIGAHKRPLREAVMAIVSAGLLIFVGVMLVGLVLLDAPLAAFIASEVLRCALFLLTALGLTLLFAVRALQKWDRPSPEELLRARPTHWRNAEHPDALRVNSEMKARKQIPARAGTDLWDEEETIVTAR